MNKDNKRAYKRNWNISLLCISMESQWGRIWEYGNQYTSNRLIWHLLSYKVTHVLHIAKYASNQADLRFEYLILLGNWNDGHF